ncbi:MAG TPA: PqiC family protein [Stellaceae bacterium]|nr:PqiC family protein [Stellaceae bacterium]
MSVRLRHLPFAVLLLVAMLAGCSSPDPVLYTLAPAAGAVYRGGPKVVLLYQIAIAHYLERSEIVRSSESYRLAVAQNDWWGEPLGAMLSRVLVEELGQRLPGSIVIADNGAVSAEPDATVELNIERLDQDAAGDLVLQAQAAVRFDRREPPLLRNFRFAVPPPAPGVVGEVAAISAAVGKLADGIVPMLTAGALAG